MAYISKYNFKFINYVSRKYKKYKVEFEFIDDYRMWLYYDYFGENKELYYRQLEKDLEEYSNIQTGKERDKRGKLSGKWEEN